VCDNPHMKFRTGLVLGLGIGFVLGARAGRERYEQIVAATGAVLGDERFQKVAAMAEKGGNVARGVAGNSLVAASERMREAASGRSVRITVDPSGNGASG